MNLNPCLHHNTTALIPIEGIDAAEGVDWQARPVKGLAMGLKYFIIKQP